MGNTPNTGVASGRAQQRAAFVQAQTDLLPTFNDLGVDVAPVATTVKVYLSPDAAREGGIICQTGLVIWWRQTTRPGWGGSHGQGFSIVATASGQLQNSILKRRSIQATVNLGSVRRGGGARRNDERGGRTNGVFELW